ncbi:hypothetical protein J7I94_08770 [Streptomyces sp. ISL-12]|uniref:hypothetical protein n=1 Tax=Streptomyces sp. ISL-12 TaxID=2819177 RepID=UPI001BEA0C5E|nr:hypothetical protein [Streptomyces sp. ISL-12]MBT2410651.1 hypothetical protein [Streptomyces sp. ISL-12]
MAAGCCVFLLTGALVAPQVAELLSAPSGTFLFVTTLLQLAGLTVGLAAGRLGARRNRGRPAPWVRGAGGEVTAAVRLVRTRRPMTAHRPDRAGRPGGR